MCLLVSNIRYNMPTYSFYACFFIWNIVRTWKKNNKVPLGKEIQIAVHEIVCHPSFWSFRKQGMWTQFFQQDGVSPHTVNVMFDILYDVFGNSVLLNHFPKCFMCGWSWPLCSPDLNPCDYFFGATSKDCACYTNPHTLRSCKLKLKLVLKRSQVACCSWQLCGSLTASPQDWRISVNMCSYEDNMHTDSPWEWTFIYVSCFSTLENYKYTIHKKCLCLSVPFIWS